MQDIKEDVIIKAREGDVDSFKKIYDVFCDYVYTIVFRILGNKEDTEEIVQDVFLKIHDKLKSFKFRSSFKTWMYRIAVNASFNAYKKRKKDFEKKAYFDERFTNTKEVNNSLQHGLEEENESLITKLLGILKPEQRACVVLRNVESLSYKEIADTLKININTVRTRLKRARESLLRSRQKRGEQNEMQ